MFLLPLLKNDNLSDLLYKSKDEAINLVRNPDLTEKRGTL